jgi:hypothetical protein
MSHQKTMSWRFWGWNGRILTVICGVAVLVVPLVLFVAAPRFRQSTADAVLLDQRNQGVSAFDTKVRFWGKVLDQDGQPVEGATIKAIVTTLRMIKVEGGYREYDILTTQSAADGSFMFDGAEGFSLTIRQLSKEGYVLPSAYQAGTRWEGARITGKDPPREDQPSCQIQFISTSMSGWML